MVIPFPPPSMQGVGTCGGLQLEVEDRSSGPIANLAATTFGIVGAASKEPVRTEPAGTEPAGTEPAGTGRAR
jgi:hypothetical protein